MKATWKIQILFKLTLSVLFVVSAAAAATAQDAGADETAAGKTEEAKPMKQADPARSEEGDAPLESFFAETTVTATGTRMDTFEVSTPVSVLDRDKLEERTPLNASDLLRTEPGVDVNGVGPNQSRPVIRGQRGLRVLFLENGLRMNNARRQSDFGETPGLVEVESLEAVEVVRGPASVLYGSDAIGGVLNVITRAPSFGGGLTGSAGLRFGSAGDATKVHASASGGSERISWNGGFSVRSADDYEAASGRFGDIDLADAVPVVDTGLDDDDVFGQLAYQGSDRHQFSLRLNRYRADQAGFGFVEPELLETMDDFRIRILYPFQDFDRYTFGYVGAGFESVLADTLELQAYLQNNERQLANDIDVFEPARFPGAPGTAVASDTLNFTDLETLGLRLETVKGIADKHLLTYGAEYFEDDSFNTDRSETTVSLVFPGPPFEVPVAHVVDTVPNSPNAVNESYGVFAQAEMAVAERFKVTLGARYQNVATAARETPGWTTAGLDFDDDSLVAAASFVYRASDNVRVVGSYGSAFRAPSIVERLFNGPTPEGIGFQVLNPDLVSEESENFDVGLKYRRKNALFDITFFRNDIDNGIIQKFFSPAEVARLPQAIRDQIEQSGVQFVVQQQNIDRLRYEGVELRVDYVTTDGWSWGGNYTHLDDERLDALNPPTGDSFGDKFLAYTRFEPPRGRYWVEYRVRHNESEKANLQLGDPIPPAGEILPAFTVHSLSGGLHFGGDAKLSHHVTLSLDNATDELYAEFSNVTFFRPEPERNVVVSYRLGY